MAFWEFLIQKEGDRSWLPLGSSKVEILEGRYRIVAHSERSNTPVEIRIIHDATAEIPPIRRTQKRVSQTNNNGLVAILPFTRLLPGVWELRCTSDLMADMLGEGWQHSVQLQVLPLEADEDWEPDWLEAHNLVREAPPQPLTTVPSQESEKAPLTANSGDGFIARHESPLHSVLGPEISSAKPAKTEEASQPAATDEPPILSTDTPPDTTPDTAPAATASDLLPLAERTISSAAEVPARLRLGQDTFIIQRGQSLMLMGQVEASNGQPTEQPVSLTALQVRLYDPRTSNILAEQQQPLTDRPLPFPFTCQITLPDDFQTYLVLGEVILHTGPAAISQSFSVTTDLHELLDAIANDFSDIELLPPPGLSSEAEALAPLDSTPLPSAPTDTIVQAVQFHPSPQQPLPPQLYPATASADASADQDGVRKPLDLPSFPIASTPASSADVHPAFSDPAAGNGSSLADRPIAEYAGHSSLNPEMTVPAFLDPGAMAATTPSVVPQAFDNDAPLPDWEQLERTEPPPSPSVTDSPEDVAFRSLNLQSRFWNRLQSLASDRELVEWLRTIDPVFESRQAGVETAAIPPVVDRESELTAQEIVVEDELTDNSSAMNGVSMDSAATMPVLPIQEPVPVPELEIATDELIAGEQTSVRVVLPYGLPRLLVKLWFVDRQQRTLLDGPHWLLDFAPDGFGHLVTETKLLVPYGCVEIQVEAIAIEMATQRESNKAIVVCGVVPPDLSVPLDEIDVWLNQDS
ncbi:hypothetical protein [Thermocoleostomius sinensis]|uniref:Uncharacterized protein n=1 Tax=Thermocoleostomius sinensis A174 TaxID=2016057 RepID=A0A9E8ZGD6_9CYAN|nr:hypothetical protein [Thermocoleostomius sinensis]WAL62653.1 hypothetical protein OXH18_11870 [Thermocoleostomius sinensis A174]